MEGSCAKCESGKCCCVYSRKGIKFGLAFGIPNALFILALGWAGWLFGYGMQFIDYSSGIYYGYSATLLGGLIGAVWGFVLGFIYGFIFGLVLKCCSGCCGKCGTTSSGSSCSMPNSPR